MTSPRIWIVVLALSFINFGIAFILAADTRAFTARDLLFETGTYMAVAGISFLVWLIIGRNGNGRGK